MQEVDRATVENLKLVIKSLERDKRLLKQELHNILEQKQIIDNIIRRGDRVDYCGACGVYHASCNRCDCSEGIDY